MGIKKSNEMEISTGWPWISSSFDLRRFGKGGDWEFRGEGYYVIFMHLLGLRGLLFLVMGHVPWQHFLFVFSVGYIGSLGVFAGAHRLWSHRSYKARLPLRLLLVFMQSLAGQNHVIRWVRDHRLHHKYCETDADPHNINRGTFFSHLGWIMIKEHPKLTEKEESIDLSDLHGDPILEFQHRHFVLVDFLLFQTLPVLIPHYIWGTPLYTSMCINYFRLLFFSHVASLGNSVAHSWIRRPYEKNIGPSDITWLSLLLVGEGWHNFHHVFPWDYRSTDVGHYGLNLCTMFIDLMCRIGWAYDLKTVPDHVIRKRAARTGDGSVHPTSIAENKKKLLNDDDLMKTENTEETILNSKSCNKVNENRDIAKLDVGEIGPAPWGWGDSDIPQEDLEDTVILSSSGIQHKLH